MSLEYPIASYQISGTVTGLTTPFGVGSFVLQNNGGDDLTISANGSFTFATPIASGANYNVTVFSQPLNPGQTCTATFAVGTVTTANITNVVVNCAINIHTITGTVNGLLPGNTITINPGPAPALGGSFTLNSGDPISLANIQSGTGVEFTIATQPTGQYCVVSDQNTNAIFIDSNLTMDIDCQEGYLVGNQFQSLPSNRLDIHLYPGRIGDGPGSHTTPGEVDGPVGTSRFSGPRGKDLRPDTGLETKSGGIQRPGTSDDLHALPFWDSAQTVCAWVKPEVLPKDDGDTSPILEYGSYSTDRLFALVLARVEE